MFVTFGGLSQHHFPSACRARCSRFAVARWHFDPQQGHDLLGLLPLMAMTGFLPVDSLVPPGSGNPRMSGQCPQ